MLDKTNSRIGWILSALLPLWLATVTASSGSIKAGSLEYWRAGEVEGGTWNQTAPAQSSSSQMDRSAAQGQVWRQFDFQDGQYFSYEVFASKGQMVDAMPVEIELVDQDRGMWAAWIRIGRARREEDITVSFPRNDLSPLLQGGWAQTADQKLLRGTILWHSPEMEGRELTPGSRWSLPGRDGEGTARVLEGGCSEASISGVPIEFSGSTAQGSVK